MAQLTTERMSDQSEGLDLLPLEDGARLLFAGQQEALNEVEAALPAIAEAAKYVSASLKSGARLVYAAAGSSGLMAAADGLELPGTFGVAPGQIRILMAGGLPTGSEMPGFTEDETDEAETADIDEADTVIAVSASGTTPYALAVAKEAKARGASGHRDRQQRRHATFGHRRCRHLPRRHRPNGSPDRPGWVQELHKRRR